MHRSHCVIPGARPVAPESGRVAGGASAARTDPQRCRRSNPAARHMKVPAPEGADVGGRSAQAFARVANSAPSRSHVLTKNERIGPKCRDGGAGSHEWVLRQSFGAETIAVDEAYRNQTGCGRNRSVAWTRAPVAKTSGTRRRAGADRWHGGGHERSADGEGRVHLVFHPNNGGVTQSNEPPTNPGRFTPS